VNGYNKMNGGRRGLKPRPMTNRNSMKLLFLLSLLALACVGGAAADAPLPTGVTRVNTDPPPKSDGLDEGFPTTAAAVQGKYLWLGRDGGLRRYDRDSLSWEFFKYNNAVCKGTGTINVVPDGRFIWGRLTNTGALCRLNPEDRKWSTLDHWTVKIHSGTGFPFLPDKDVYFVAGSGGPEWEGVSLIDRKSGEWIKLLKTKPVSAMHVEPRHLWLGVPEGILRINRITEEYTYTQPFEHGGGAMVKDIAPIPGGLAFATMGDRTGILGDKLQITKNTIKVYMQQQKTWYTYDKSERYKILQDIQAGRIVVTNVTTNPGLLTFKNNKWKLLTVKDGLPGNEILDLETDSRYLYVSTYKGICALELKSLQPAVLNQSIANSIRQVRRTVSDDKYLWIFSNRGLFRVEKKYLFSAPRQQRPAP